MSAKRARRAEAPRWIAEERVVFVWPDGTRAPGRILVGEPEAVSAQEGRCPVALEGVLRVTWVHGASTLQALALGVRLLHFMLQSEREHGLRVCFEARGGKLEDVPLDATFGVGGWGVEDSGGQQRAPHRTKGKTGTDRKRARRKPR